MKRDKFNVGDYVALVEMPICTNSSFMGYNYLEINKLYKIIAVSGINIQLDVKGIENYSFKSENFITNGEYRELKLIPLLD